MIEEGRIARQPILKADGTIYGYELLYRSGAGNSASVVDDNHATSSVLVSALNTFGLDKLVGQNKAFINVGRDLLMDPILEVVPQEKFILEILEDVVVDDALKERVEYLASLGYSIAIDDLNFQEDLIENFEPLFAHSDILKFDLMQTNLQEVNDKLKYFQNYNLQLLAEKVETLEEFQGCKDAGFDYFQGYFFSKPDMLSKKKVDPSQAVVIRLISMLNADREIKQIEEEFFKAPELAINLLKYLNSAAFSTRTQIDSISHAINLLGKTKLAKWLTLYLYSGANQNQFSVPIMESAIFRAKFMSELAGSLKQDRKMQDKAYLTGMISLVDVLLQTSFDEIFQEISFDTDIQKAIMHKDGKLGKLLSVTKNVEILNEKVVMALQKAGVNEKRLNDILLNCHQYVNAATSVKS